MNAAARTTIAQGERGSGRLSVKFNPKNTSENIITTLDLRLDHRQSGSYVFVNMYPCLLIRIEKAPPCCARNPPIYSYKSN